MSKKCIICGKEIEEENPEEVTIRFGDKDFGETKKGYICASCKEKFEKYGVEGDPDEIEE